MSGKPKAHQCSHGPWTRARIKGEWSEALGWKCVRCGALRLGEFPDAVEAMLAGAPYGEKP